LRQILLEAHDFLVQDGNNSYRLERKFSPTPRNTTVPEEFVVEQNLEDISSLA